MPSRPFIRLTNALARHRTEPAAYVTIAFICDQEVQATDTTLAATIALLLAYQRQQGRGAPWPRETTEGR